MKVPTVIQMQQADNAAAALCTMLGFFGRHVSMEDARAVCPTSRSGTQPALFTEAASAFGLDAELREMNLEELKRQHMPIVARWRHRYYVVVKGFRRGRVQLSDPAKGEYEMSEEKFATLYQGSVIVCEPGEGFKREGHPEKLSELIVRRLGGMKRDLVKLFFINLAAVALNLAFVEGVRRMLEESTFAGTPSWVYFAAIAVESIILLACTCFAIWKTLLVNNVGRRLAARSGAQMFKHLFRLPAAFFDQISAGELMQRIDNNTMLDRSLMLSLIPRAIDVITAVMYLVLMFSYNVYVALACLAVEVVYLVAMRLQQNALALRSRSMITSSGNMNAAVLNGMGTIETIKTSGAERVFFNMWKRSQAEFQESSRSNLQMNGVTQFIAGAHSVFSSAALLFAGAYFMTVGSFDAAAMAAMQMIVGRVGGSLSNCLNTLNSLQTMRTNIERVEDLSRRPVVDEIPLSEGDEADKLRGDLEVDHVSFRYNQGDPFAVDDVSLSIKQGQMYAIVGKTGCGKSTLLKLMADLYPVTQGEIRYGGKGRSEIPDVVFRSSVVTVDQEVMMFEDTIRSNLTMWDDTIEDYEMLLAARDAQIHPRIIREVHGYDTVMRENGKGFSGGELQRLELARALEKDPTFLLLDEFTSALDAMTEEKVMQAIRERGTTCVIVAHRLSTVRDADQIVVMQDGRIAEQGTHDELMALNGLYRALVATE